MNVLVIVDMQAGYAAAQERALVGRIRARAAKVLASGGRVVAISMNGSGPQTVNLTPTIPILWKDEDDGGNIVYAWLVGAGLVQPDVRIEVAGTNLCACVMATACGIAERLYEEHAMCDNVTINTKLCGDGARFKVRFV